MRYPHPADHPNQHRRMVVNLTQKQMTALLRMVSPLLDDPLPADVEAYGMAYDFARDCLMVGITSASFEGTFDGTEALSRGLELRRTL